MRPDAGIAMANQIRMQDDAVGRWLDGLKPTTAVFCRAEVRAPWGFSIGRRDGATFHSLTDGTALLEVDGVRGPDRLAAGDLVLLPTGAAHALRDAPGSAAPSLEAAVGAGVVDGKHVEFGGDGPRAVMVCGSCSMGVPGLRPSAGVLPVRVKHRVDPVLMGLVDAEASRADAGAEAILTQLLSLLLMQALRAQLVEKASREGYAALSPDIAAAVAYVHEHFDEELGLRDLCAQASVSRSVLAERFRDSLRVSPMQYVRMTRLSKAAELLLSSSSGLARVARTVGYRSTSAFSRAFQREYGMAPGAYRSTARSASGR